MSIIITRADASVVTFTKLREETNDSVLFIADDHTFDLRHQLLVTRRLPSSNSMPTSRYAYKLTRDVLMADGLTVRAETKKWESSVPAGYEADTAILDEDARLISVVNVANEANNQLPV